MQESSLIEVQIKWHLEKLNFLHLKMKVRTKLIILMFIADAKFKYDAVEFSMFNSSVYICWLFLENYPINIQNKVIEYSD